MDEFDFINNIKKKYSLDRVGDDCAVLPKDGECDLLMTADMLVEDVDFRLDWTPPKFLGRKVLSVSLSDIAAMGGTPRWAMLSLGVPEQLWTRTFLDEFYEGWHELAASFEVELAGGDVSRTLHGLVIDSVVGGEVPRGQAVLRSGAKPGDGIFVSGQLGGAAAGLRMLDEGSRYSREDASNESKLLLRQLSPSPRVELGSQLRRLGLATSMIDLSDGLSSDLAHLCEASRTGAVIYANQLPVSEELITYASSSDAVSEFTLHGGEDFELLFTADKKKISESNLGDIFLIGEITETPAKIELVRDGRREILPPRGYRHF